ncbi:MAG: hypothetical protein ACJ796_09330 [Gemmatimonadaceae bacterium]
MNKSARALCSDNGFHVEVLNAALPGMSLPTVEQDIRLRVAKLHPDVITLYPTPVQYLDDDAPVAIHPRASGAPSPSWVKALYPRAAGRLWEQAKILLPALISTRLRALDIAKEEQRHPQSWKFEAIPQDRLLQYDSDLRRIVGSIRSAGAVPVLMTHANRFMGSGPVDPTVLTMWERMYPRSAGATLVAFDSAAGNVSRQVARDSSVVIADVASDLGRNGERAFFQDYAHFTDLGAARVAGELRRAIGPMLFEACAATARSRQSHPLRSSGQTMAEAP